MRVCSLTQENAKLKNKLTILQHKLRKERIKSKERPYEGIVTFNVSQVKHFKLIYELFSDKKLR